MTEVLKVLGSYNKALRGARGNSAREAFTLAAPAIVLLLAVTLVAGALG